MTSSTLAPFFSSSSDDHPALGAAVAAQVTQLAHPPRLLGFGEPMHGEDEFLHVRNAVFAALAEQAGFTTIAIESSAWHGRVVDAYVRGGPGTEDMVMAAGFTHGFGASAANRALVRWLREENRDRPREEQLRFAGFDTPTEQAAADSPRAALQALHEFLSADDAFDVPSWELLDGLLGPDDGWTDPAGAMDPARSIGAQPRVHQLRAITDDLRRALASALPCLRGERGADAVEDALLAGRIAAGLLAYHALMATDGDQRWSRLAAARDLVMAENLDALARRGPTLAFAHNQHLRTGTTSVSFGSQVLRWQPAGAHLADRMGRDYRVIASVLGEAAHQEIPEPAPDSFEGAFHAALPAGYHLLPAPAVLPLLRQHTPRVSPTFRYIPADAELFEQVDQVLYLDRITPDGG